MPEAQQLEIESLIGQLTVEEKASFCIGADFWHTASVDRLGIPLAGQAQRARKTQLGFTPAGPQPGFLRLS